MLTQSQMQAIDDLTYASRNAIVLRNEEIDICILTLYDAQQILTVINEHDRLIESLKDIILKQDIELEQLHAQIDGGRGGPL